MKKVLAASVAVITLFAVILFAKGALLLRGSHSSNLKSDSQQEILSTYYNEAYGIRFTYPNLVTLNTGFKSFHLLGETWKVGVEKDSHATPLAEIVSYQIDRGDVYMSYPMYYAALLRVGVSSSTSEVSNCLQGGESAGSIATTIMINGTNWTVVPFGDAGMMQYLSGESYRTVRGGTCIIIEKIKTGSNYRDAQSVDDVSDVDLEDEYLALDTIMNSVEIDEVSLR